MNVRTYSTSMRAIVVALAAVIAVSVAMELPLYVPVLGIIFALLVARTLRRLVSEIMTDERDRRIDEKATSLSYRIYTVLVAAVALTALMLRSSLPAWAGVAAETLAYSVCGLMLVHVASRRYYRNRL